MKYDGLSNTKYTLLETSQLRLYTKVRVKLPGPTTVSDAKAHFRHLKSVYQALLDRSDSNNHSDNDKTNSVTATVRPNTTTPVVPTTLPNKTINTTIPHYG